MRGIGLPQAVELNIPQVESIRQGDKGTSVGRGDRVRT